VEPVAPFLTAEIAAGVDGFFQARLLAEFQLLSPERQACYRSSSHGAGGRKN
jgi:hypothetical protein